MILDLFYIGIFTCVIARILFDAAMMLYHHFKGTEE